MPNHRFQTAKKAKLKRNKANMYENQLKLYIIYQFYNTKGTFKA